MKLVCLDKTAADRLRLHKLIDEAFTACRASVGHLAQLAVRPISREELLLSGPKGATVLIGWGYSLEDAAAICSDLQDRFAGTPVIIFAKEEALSLRSLHRFERYSAELLSIEDNSTRIVHTLLRAMKRRQNDRVGKLITIAGAKGGVGVTSLATGFAHAAESVGLKAIIHDLSSSSALSRYLAAPRRHSTDYRSLLTDRLVPSPSVVERCTVLCPNGIMLLLPPAGGAEIRDCWIRDSESLDISLALFDLLAEMYDLIIVDLEHADGLLPFALQARADVRALVSSNDPASVHLLGEKLTELAALPIRGKTSIILTLLQERSLTERDVRNFLHHHESVDDAKIDLRIVSPDRRAANWIGTGNSLYTEGSARLQSNLEHLLLTLLDRPVSQPRPERRFSLIPPFGWRRAQAEAKPRALPEPTLIFGSERANSFDTGAEPEAVAAVEPTNGIGNGIGFAEGSIRTRLAAGGYSGVFGS